MNLGDQQSGATANGEGHGRSDRLRGRLAPMQLRHGLPAPRSSVIGREETVEDVQWRLLMSPLVTVTGPGGVGKSRLALEVAARLAEEGHEVAFVDLGSVPDPGLLLPAVASAIGVDAEHGASLVEAVVAHVGDAGLVLVLDTCEHLRPWCPQLTERLLERCGGLRVLATSRGRLGVTGEVVVPLAPLSLPEAEVAALPEAFVASEAVQLFCDRAAALQRGFVPTPETIGAITEICRRLDANPLAIELAAARVVALPPAEIAARLDDRFRLLAGGPSTAPSRHRSLGATIEWSHNLLSVPERALLRRLSVFGGCFTLRAAEEVCGGDDVEPGQVLESLAALVESSLVVAEPSGSAGRFRLPVVLSTPFGPTAMA